MLAVVFRVSALWQSSGDVEDLKKGMMLHKISLSLLAIGQALRHRNRAQAGEYED